jgi:hypothetical protein
MNSRGLRFTTSHVGPAEAKPPEARKVANGPLGRSNARNETVR